MYQTKKKYAKTLDLTTCPSKKKNAEHYATLN